MSRAYRASVEAFYLADGGLEERVASLAAVGPSGETVYDASTGAGPHHGGGGVARVAWERLLALPGAGAEAGAILRVTSTGTAAAPDKGPARRLVGRLVLLPPAPVPPAALTTLAGASVSGDVAISGIDVASPACPGAAGPRGGVAIPTPEALQGSPSTLEGDPALLVGEPAGARAWSAALAAPEGGAREEEDASPPGPDEPPPDGDAEWAIVRLGPGPASLRAGDGGRGAIIAEGDLSLEEGFRWEGLLFVRGALRVAGDVRILGAVVAGLDRAADAEPAASALQGPVEVRWHSCHVETAAAALRPPAIPIPGTWFESY